MRFELKLFSKILSTFLGVFFLLVIFSLLFSKGAYALDDETEAYGWGRTVVGTAATNTVRFFWFDAHTHAPINPDNFTVSIFHYGGVVFSAVDWCDTACPNSYTFSGFPNDSCMAPSVTAQKSGYHNTFMTNSLGYCVSFSGDTLLTVNVYLTLDSDPFQIKLNYPGIGHSLSGQWLNYLPSPYTIQSRPSFDTGSTNLTLYWLICGQPWAVECTGLSSIGPLGTPFPTTSTVTPSVAHQDGLVSLDGWNIDDSQAHSSNRGVAAYIDRVPPTVSCSAAASGSTITVNLSAVDSSGASDPWWAKGAGVAAGDVDVSTDGGATWTNNGLPNGGDTLTSPFYYTGTPGTTYTFQFSAKDATYDKKNNQNQWSSFYTCATITIPPTPPDYTLSWGDVSNPSIGQGDSVDYSIVVNPQCSPAWAGSLDVTILNPSITPNDGHITSVLVSPPSSMVTISCLPVPGSGSQQIVYKLTADPSTPLGNVYDPVHFTATSSLPPKYIDGKLTINAAQWLQTTGGDVYSLGDINTPLPSGNFTSDYLLQTGGSNISNSAKSRNNWVVTGYGALASVTPTYNSLFAQVGAGSLTTITCGSNLNPTNLQASLPANHIIVCSGSSGATVATSNNNLYAEKRLRDYLLGILNPFKVKEAQAAALPGVSNATVIFVNGDLTIDTNLDYTTTLVFYVVSGQIKIKNSVNVINAFLYSENGINTNYYNDPTLNRLIINGAVFIGTNAANGSVVFNRKVSNASSTAAEQINYDPRVLSVLTNYIPQLGTTGTLFTEVKP